MNAFATPQRRRLPNRRMASTHDIDAGNTRVTATIGFDEAGRPAELFLSNGKAGSEMDALLGDIAVIVSVALPMWHHAGMLGKSCGRAPAPDGSHLVAASAAAAALDLLAGLDPRTP